jgi:predicted small integral membrane protein
MSHFTTAGAIRRSKVLIVFMASLFGLMTLTNNFTDYAAYSDYIGQIISMSDTQGNDSRRYRGVTSTMFHHRFYWTIITLEIIFTFSFLLGTYHLLRNINASPDDFHEAKKFSIIGLLILIFIYYLCIQVIGVEWFDMDTSSQWNAKDWARHIVDFIFHY